MEAGCTRLIRSGPQRRKDSHAGKEADTGHGVQDVAAKTEKSDDRRIDRQQQADANEQRDLVARAEEIDGDLFHPCRDTVDNAITDIDDRRAQPPGQTGNELSNPQAERRARPLRPARRPFAREPRFVSGRWSWCRFGADADSDWFDRADGGVGRGQSAGTTAPNQAQPTTWGAVTMNDVNPLRRLRAVPSNDDTAAGETEASNRALTRAGRGDEAAFAEFYDLVSGLVYGVIRKVVRDPSMSDEVTQEVFLELWRLAPRYDASKGTAKSWAATIAHRRAVDRVRSEQSRRNREERELTVTDDARDVVSEFVGERLDHDSVRAGLAHLTEAQREAVTLAYYGGHTYRAVAALLDVPEGTIKTRIRDGLIHLRDHLEVTP